MSTNLVTAVYVNLVYTTNETTTLPATLYGVKRADKNN
jgi:hypothetical protein